MRRIVLLILLCAAGNCARAAEYSIEQRNKMFIATSLHVKVGDVLVFVNYDPYVHNVFSLSDVQSFDLGSFGKGEVRKVQLTSPGRLTIECAVHPAMSIVIDVSK